MIQFYNLQVLNFRAIKARSCAKNKSLFLELMLPKFAKKDPSKAVLFQKWRQYKNMKFSKFSTEISDICVKI